ncbi:MAG: helix-turn-helix domain-containing protein [Bacteroides sp.]|nr:helix-turn-helix domain-containing protein [Bacteroides sp.]
MEIGKSISDRRRQLGITQQDLAEMAEVGIATIKDIERGKGNPSLKTLEKICTVLGLVIHLDLKKNHYLIDLNYI